MEYNVGDTVYIKSKKWYKNTINRISVQFGFNTDMAECCGKKAIIIRKDFLNFNSSYAIAYKIDICAFTWSEEMFESIKQIRKRKLKKIQNDI